MSVEVRDENGRGVKLERKGDRVVITQLGFRAGQLEPVHLRHALDELAPAPRSEL